MANEKAPGVVSYGIDDQSSRKPTPVPELLPDSLPIIYTFASKGDRTPRYVTGAAMNNVYGSRTWEADSKFFTHQTAMGKIHAANSGIMVQRLVPPNAKSAMVRLSLLVVPCRLPVYKRSPNGTYLYNGSGVNASLVQDVDATGDPLFTNGYRTVIVAGNTDYPEQSQPFGEATLLLRAGYGATVNSKGESLGVYQDENGIDVVADATLYPLLDALVLGEGEEGNDLGIRLRSTASRDRERVDFALVEQLRSMLYRTSIVRRSASGVSNRNIQTVTGADFLDLGFGDDLTLPSNRQPISLENRLFEDWDLNQPGYVPEPGPFEAIHVYQESLNEMLERLTQGEVIDGVEIQGEGAFDDKAFAYGRDADFGFSDIANASLFNFLLNTDYNGVPYFAVDVSRSATFGGVAPAKDLVIFAQNGEDGLPLKANGQPDRLATLLLLDQLVMDELESFGDKEYARVLDMARYPIRGFWDSGFSMDTKKMALGILSKRSDMYVILATQSVADWIGNYDDPKNFVMRPANTDDEDRAIALELSNAAYLYPESEVFGTQVCRAMVIGHAGQLLTEYPRPLVPMTFDFAAKVSNFMGAAKWRDQYAFDLEGRKEVSILQRVNNTWKTPAGYDQSWENNLVYVQYGDRRNLFYPQFQTVYRDDTSVLNDAFVMMACCSLQWLHFQVWRELTPTGSMSDDKLIETSDRKLAEKVKDRYNGRFVINPETTLTATDEQNGRSWHASYKLYANASRDRVYSSVVTYRMSDLQA